MQSRFFLILSTCLLIPFLSYAGTEKCSLTNAKVIKTKANAKGKTCAATSLCFVDADCLEMVGKNEIPVSRQFVCEAPKGACPADLQECIKNGDAEFSVEGQMGMVGQQDWAAVVANTGADMAKMYYKKKILEESDKRTEERNRKGFRSLIVPPDGGNQ